MGTEQLVTREELESLHPEVADQPDGRVDAALKFAKTAIRSLCATDVDNDVLKFVVCQATARMLRSDEAAGVSQESWSASPYSGSVTYANPAGDLYLTAFEKKLLGIEGTDMEAVFVTPGESYEEDEAHV